ncbi:MAG: hypothetical protein M9894_19710 [Planctomycetes bacterium]|nr:hypothetical protein [Planctomycetota bacterium]
MVVNQKKQLRRRRRSGQGMTEYIIIVGLIAICLVAAVKNFRDAVGTAFDKGTETIDTEITGKIGEGHTRRP